MCFAMNSPSRQSALHYLAGIHARGRELATVETQQIHLDFNRMCNTQNARLLSFHLLDASLARAPANCLRSCFSEVKYYLKNVDDLEFPREELQAVCAPDVQVKVDLLLLCNMAARSKYSLECAVMAEQLSRLIFTKNSRSTAAFSSISCSLFMFT